MRTHSKTYFLSSQCALFCVLIICLLGLNVNAQITRTPYVQKVDQSSLAIAWRSASAEIFELRYGTDPGNLNQTLSTTSGTIHELDITGLSPYTEYFYEVWNSSGTMAYPNTPFYTAKPDTMPDFDMLVFGDCGVANSNQYAVRDLMAADQFDFGIVCGDVTQQDGTDYDTYYFDVYKDIIDEKCFYPAIGNHDLFGYPSHNNTAQQFLEDFALFTNNPMGTEEYYSFEYGNAKLICLHVNFVADYQPGSAQYQWLEEELSCRTTDWVFVYFHQPPFVNGWDFSWLLTQYDGEDEVRNHLVPVFEQYDVDFVFNGHMHGYERGELNGVKYVTSGGGGGNLDFAFPNGWSHISVANYDHHYLKIEVDGPTMSVTATNKNGDVIDNFTSTKAQSALVAEWKPRNFCSSAGIVDLNTLLHPTATPGGQWAGTGITGSNFDPFGLSGPITISYTVGNAPCTKTATYPIEVQDCILKAQLMLEGPYNTAATMHHELVDQNLLPLNQPFNTAPWNYTGTESLATLSDFPSNTVDWILLEARSLKDTLLIETKAGLLLDDGSVVDTDGITTGLRFNTLAPNSSYFIAIKARNHLATMSATAQSIPMTNSYDFRSASSQSAQLSTQTMVEAGVYALRAGDSDGKGQIDANDATEYYAESSAVNSYQSGDFDMDGHVTISDFNLQDENQGEMAISKLQY